MPTRATFTCVMCGDEVTDADYLKRCRACREAGRGRCPSCGKEVQVPYGRGHSGQRRCNACREQPRWHTGGLRLVLHCRGVDLPWGGTGHGPTCPTEVDRPVRYAKRLQTFDATSNSYICRSCMGYGLWLASLPMKEAALKRAGIRFERVKSLASAKAVMAKHVTTVLADNERLAAGKAAALAARPDTRRYPPGGILKRAVTRWKNHGRTVEVGICQLPECAKLTFWYRAHRPLAFHHSCVRGVLRANIQPRGGWSKVRPPEPGRQRGRPRVEGRLARDFLFALQHVVLGESMREIASSASVTPMVVSRGVAEILDRLPAPEQVMSKFRPYVEALQLAVPT